jgi:UDP-N-acetylmuramate dehydrogenase
MLIPSLIRQNEPLKKHCTLRIGGTADFFAEPSTEGEIAELFSFVTSTQIPFVVIGRGSNILFDDEGFRGLVIKFGKKFSSVVIEDDMITAQAGAWMPHVARRAQVNGLAGLEHTVGIPGTIGGIVVMNAGSKRKYIGGSIINVRAMLLDGVVKTIPAAACGFGYRQSIFQKETKIVVGVTLKCEKGDPVSIRKEMLAILRERRWKFPLKEHNCGSVFRSDPEIYAKYGPPGKIIEDLGGKGFLVGGIAVSEKHANFFVNRLNGTAQDYLKLIEYIKQRAYSEMEIVMKPEVHYIHSIQGKADITNNVQSYGLECLNNPKR